ncbi:MAG: CARDB domain-containing protein [Candidatus Aenigmatarchaeota archaeon]
MKRIITKRSIILLLIFFISIDTSLGFECTIKSGSCGENETCLFSLYSNENTHAGECGYYDYQLCCDEITSANIKSSCDTDEGGVISLYQANNSHAERYGYGSYSKHVCVKPAVNCTMRDACESGETQVITLFSETNSHLGQGYSNKICCKFINTAPIVILMSIDGKGNNSYINDSTPAVQFNVTDNQQSTLSCELWVDNNPGYGLNSSVLNNTPTIIDVNQSLSDGSHTLFVNCSDGSLTNVSETWTFTVDTQAPTTTATAVKDDGSSYTFNTWTNSSYINVTLTCDDGSGAGCSVTQYCLDTTNTCTPSTTYSTPVQITTEGISYIRFRSNDTLGNLESTKTETIKIDTTPPSVTINSPQNTTYSTTSIILNTTITDAYSGLDVCWYSLDNWATNTTYNCVNKTLTLSEGSYTLRVAANDTLGNLNNTESVSFTISVTAARPDLYVNSSSIVTETLPVFNETVNVNITVWNIGDANASSVNVSCYENSTYFDSFVISNIENNSEAHGQCNWTVSCNNNISIIVDPANGIEEENETNNNASSIIQITEKLGITIDSPSNGQEFYRNETISLNSTVTSSCQLPNTYTVRWYNSTSQIAEAEDTTWTIPINYELGEETINVSVNSSGYVSASDQISINILNNLPNISELGFEPSSVLVNEAITISCNITDVENSASNLSVNISIKNPYGEWNNASASRLGNTFYRDWLAQEPIGTYLAKCYACDLDNGCSQRNATFTVYKQATVSVSLNQTEVWWNDSIAVNGTAKRSDNTAIDTSSDPESDVKIIINSVIKAITETSSTGYYNATIYAPSAIGAYTVNVSVRDPITGKIFSNTTQLIVKPQYGEEKAEQERARNIGCYEEPRIIQNPDGTIRRVVVRVCTWK